MLILDRWTKYIQIYIILSPRLKSTSFCMFEFFSFLTLCNKQSNLTLFLCQVLVSINHNSIRKSIKLVIVPVFPKRASGPSDSILLVFQPVVYVVLDILFREFQLELSMKTVASFSLSAILFCCDFTTFLRVNLISTLCFKS